VRWVGLVACDGEMRNTVLIWNFWHKDHMEDLGIGGRILLRWFWKKLYGKAWAGLIWLRMGSMTGCFEQCNWPAGSIKCGQFLYWLRNCYFL
jgi:hypothetical protein